LSTIVERVRSIVEPLLTARSLEVYDIEHAGGSLRILVDRADGIDLGALSDVTRAVSRALDEADPIEGRYTLEVSSPGLERPLRTPGHFARAIGTEVAVKTVPDAEGDRRIRGQLVSVDDDGIAVVVDGEPHHVRFGDIERARTVFEWGPTPKSTTKKSKDAS
jgi:ribosome maturation factor RimP